MLATILRFTDGVVMENDAGGRGLRWHELLTDVGVELGVVEVADKTLDGLNGPVPAREALSVWPVAASEAGRRRRRGGKKLDVHLEVTTDEELARHFGGCCCARSARKTVGVSVAEWRQGARWSLNVGGK